jgi:methionyl-tRNA synthetase
MKDRTSAQSSRQRILVAPAWPYASGPRHLGHVSSFAVPSDIVARYHRLKGDDVLMVSGTDEHGTPVMVAADREGRSYRETADRYNELIRADVRDLGISYDLFTRTTTSNHARVVRDVFRALYANGYIFEQTTLGAFSARTGHTLPDRYIEGTCPICGFPEARGDQCDNCGNLLDPIDLKEPRSKVDGTTPVFRETNHLFLDLPAFADRLAAWIEKQDHWRPNVRNFSLSYLEDLRPRPVTRDLDWGVRIPVAGYDADPNKRIYVWIDAVVGYLSAAVEWAAARGTPDAWRDWWQDPDARHHYFMGKDNIVFHTIIWPAELIGYGTDGELGAGRRLELPYEVVASEYLTMGGAKASTSRNVAINVRDFLDRYDADALRYYLTAAGPETRDTEFTWEEFVRRNNDELVATWGNLVNRTLTSAYRNFGTVPEPGPVSGEDQALLARSAEALAEVGELIERSRFRAALAQAMRFAREANQYVSEQAPWALLEGERQRAATVLYVALRTVDSLKTLMTPFLPFSSQTVHELLGYEGFLAGPLEYRTHADEDGATHEVVTGDYAGWVGGWAPSELRPGQALREPRPLFRKLDAERVVAEELARLGLGNGEDASA